MSAELAGRVVTPDGVVLGRVHVDAVAGTIVAVEPNGAAVPDRWVVPGFIDLQINGTDGIDLGVDPERMHEVGEILLDEGTTAFLPTVITGPRSVRTRAIDAMAVAPAAGDRAAVLGLHFEGPVLAPARRGAHPLEHLVAPDAPDTARWTAAHGVRMVTLAPELAGATELIAELAAAGVVVSLGHTDATAEEFVRGLDAGASMCTHLFNGMRPFHHRDPGPIGAVLGRAGDAPLHAGLIADGVHVDPIAVTMAWRSLGSGGVVLVTDAVAQRTARSAPHDAARCADGTLAGSTLHLDAALRHLVAWTGAPVEEAVAAVTSVPAAVLGDTTRGAIEPGRRADLVVLDDRLEVVGVMLAGRRVR